MANQYTWDSVEEQLWAKVRITPGCWLWTSAVDGKGYGTLTIKGKQPKAHRLVYERYKGAIPDGLQLDHLCRVRNCVNPDHLEVVTNQENQLRGLAGQRNRERAVLITHCPRGHEYTLENTYITMKGWRTCRACRRKT